MGEKLDAGEVYKGPCGVLKDTNWLTAETLPTDRDTIVEIEAVLRRKTVRFKSGGRDETKNSYGSLRFRGKEKELGLNATNLRVLAALFGPDTTNWFGKKVALYVDDHVQAFGQIVSAVRIRAKRLDASAKTDQPLTEEEMAAADAKHDSVSKKKGAQ